MRDGLKAFSCLLFAATAGFPLSLTANAETGAFLYRQMCDASAAVSLDADHFVVADDETNILRVYRRGQADPVAHFDLAAFLGTKPGKESDLEGAAAIGNRIYWIASHGRDKDGNPAPKRRRFFATDIKTRHGPDLVPFGQIYTDLLEDLLEASQLAPYDLKHSAKLAPEALGGLNVEGLAATVEGKLLIGFRNPIRNGKALIVPLDNPADIVEGAKAQLGAPIELDLGGRGIRSLEFVGSDYLIVAGPFDDQGSFDLFRWSGKARATPHELVGVDLPSSLNPEAAFAIPGTGKVQILSDDGGVSIDGTKCKKLPSDKQVFRSIVIDLEPN